MIKFDYELTKAVIEQHGIQKQSIIAMEECAELIQAISKAIRYQNDNVSNYHLTEEIGDVLICIEQLKVMYGITDDAIQTWVNLKQDREWTRIQKTDSE